jgi:hypothetical protein
VLESAKPSEWVKAQLKLFGNHYCWAMGRAYASGLLGEGNEAKDRLDSAGKFVRLYGRYYGSSVYSCPLDQTPRSNFVADYDHERQEPEKDWLKAALRALELSGGMPFFEQLISRAHVDQGPVWLDRLLTGPRDPADLMVVAAAMKAMDAIPGSTREARRAA